MTRQGFSLKVNAKDYGFKPTDTPRTDRSVKFSSISCFSSFCHILFNIWNLLDICLQSTVCWVQRFSITVVRGCLFFKQCVRWIRYNPFKTYYPYSCDSPSLLLGFPGQAVVEFMVTSSASIDQLNAFHYCSLLETFACFLLKHPFST